MPNPNNGRPNEEVSRVACYVRVSTVRQNEAGQKAEIQRWLDGNGIRGASWFIDRDSGDHLERPAFEQLQKAVWMGEVQTIVVWKLDRLSRKLAEGLAVLCGWCDRGLRVVSVTQQIDFSGAVGKLLAAVLLGIAEMEQETRRERVAVGVAAAKRRGVYKGGKPGRRKVAPQRVMALKARGLSHRETARILDLNTSTVTRYIREWRGRAQI